MARHPQEIKSPKFKLDFCFHLLIAQDSLRSYILKISQRELQTDISKIKLKFVNVEIEYEGEQQHPVNDLGALLAKIENFSQHFVDLKVTTPSSEPQSVDEKTSSGQSQATRTFTVGTLAAKLNVKSGPELVTCAIGHLYFVHGKEKSDRKQILNTMQNASSYYKKTYSGNLSKSLSSLVKAGKLLETSNDNFALTADEVRRLEAIIDQLG